MNLKKLELFGFKSFMRKLDIHFSDGITVIVGPNGCGKTNVTDALRWVLGEGSARMLRGSRMEDLIFNGTRDYKPLNVAEVSLTVDNSSGILPVDYTEVTVTRKVYRNGESEFLINRVPGRLRDIHELFLDTGLGSRAYSVIEREMVEMVLADQPEKRRELLEEAAGIMKYKIRERAASRKLAATDDDLNRIQDVLREVDRQVRALKRQVGAAQRFQELREKLRELELSISLGELTKLSEETEELSRSLKEISNDRDGASARASALESDIEASRVACAETERALSESQREVEEMAEEARGVENQNVVRRERREALLEKSRRLAAENEELASRVASSQRRCTELEGERSGEEEKHRQLEEKLAEARSHVEENENALEEKKRELSRAREAFEECSSRFAALAAELAKLDTHGEHLDDRDAVLEGELAEIERAQAAKRFEQAETQARAARLAASLAELEDRLRALARELETLDIEREALRERDAALSVEIESVRSGLALLRGFRETYEGYGSGARALLSRHDGLAALADSIHPKDSDLLPAIESALEGVIQYVVAPSSGAALDAVQSLRGGAGRATLVDLSGFREASGGRRYEPMPVDGAILGPVRSFLEVSGDLRFVLDELLSRSVIVETLEDAVRLARQPQWRGYRFVARNGDWAEHPGLIHGGSTDGSGGTRILGRGDRIEELDERVTELECDRARARERLEELALERSARLAEQGTSLAEREAAREALSREDKCLERFATELSSGEGRLLTVRGEREGLLGRRDELGAKRDSLQAGARAAEEEKTRLEEARQLRESELIRASQALDLAREASHDLTLRVQRAVAEIEKLSLEILRVEESRVSDEAATRLRREELVAADRALGELARDLEEGLELFGLKAKALEEKRHLRDAVARERAEALEQLRLLEEECRRWTRARDQAQELVHENEMKLQKLELGCAELISRVEREFEVELLSPATRESYGALLDVDEETLETARHEREELRKQVERMGAVNLVALDQFDRESRRLAFLQTQKDDLEAAREKLRRAIRKINRTARRHFMETLEQVRVNFQTTFGTLFEGGHSDIRLANDEDPLEAPIEIFARPRGKRLSNISLLSSGERSLTAVAFLFAIYLVKPSPFCILDEVDAPLDDANIGRFLSMLKKVAERTQFVMITHNKKTMEVADYLYGVTMEEPGVSKLVSVRLGTEDRSLPSLEPPGESSASEAEKELVMEGSA